MSSRAQRVSSSFSEKIVFSALSARKALSQISLTCATREVGAKCAFAEKKKAPFKPDLQRMRKGGLNRLREPSVE